MHRLVWSALGLSLMAMASTARADDDLPTTQRVLLIFAQPNDPALAQQKTLLEQVDGKELRERDLLVLHVSTEGDARPLFGSVRHAYSARSLRQSRDIGSDEGFTALLVGKDGGTKWRKNRPARPDELFKLIDSMPMRALERKRNRADD